MNKDFASKLFSQPRTFPIKNLSGLEIPARSLVEITGESGGVFTVTRPTKDSLNGIVAITDGCPIAIGGCGHASFGGPLTVKYAGAAPAVGEKRGTAVNSFQLTTKKKGFKVLAVRGDLCCVREVAAVAPTFFEDYTLIQSNNPAVNYHASATPRNDGGYIYETHTEEYSAGVLSSWMVQCILNFEIPIEKPRLVLFPDIIATLLGAFWGNVFHRVTGDPYWAFGPYALDFAIELRLLHDKQDLDTVTWNTHHVDPYAATHGTYYDDTSTYDDFPAVNLINNSGVSIPSGPSLVLDPSFAQIEEWRHPIAFQHNSRVLGAVVDGEYNAAHLYFHGANITGLTNFGAGNNPGDTMISTLACAFPAVLESLTGKIYPRPYATDDEYLEDVPKGNGYYGV